MALVEIARFSDLTEAHVAAAGLRASGMMAFVQNAQLGQTLFHMQIAFGGFRLWTVADEAEAARDYVRACRTVDRAAVRWTNHPGLFTTAPLAILGMLLYLTTGTNAWLLAGLRRRFSLVALVILAGCIAFTATLIWWAWTPHEMA